MKYLITGHNGFIGRNYIEHLRKKDKTSQIYGLSRTKINTPLNNIKEIDLNLSNPFLNTIIGEIKPDVIIHLASRRFGSLDELFEDNVIATENLLIAVKNLKKPTKTIIIGSSAEIGQPKGIAPIKENDICTPVDYYGLTKLMQSNLAYQYSIHHSIHITRLRFFNILGQRMPDTLLAGKAIQAFKKELRKKETTPINFGDLTSFRDYVDIKDICNAIDLAIKNGKTGELYNIGSGKATQGIELINKLIDACPIKSPLLSYTYDSKTSSIVPIQIANISKVKIGLKWKPLISLEETLKDMWTYELNND